MGINLEVEMKVEGGHRREESRVFHHDLLSPLGMRAENEERLSRRSLQSWARNGVWIWRMESRICSSLSA